MWDAKPARLLKMMPHTLVFFLPSEDLVYVPLQLAECLEKMGGNLQSLNVPCLITSGALLPLQKLKWLSCGGVIHGVDWKQNDLNCPLPVMPIMESLQSLFIRDMGTVGSGNQMDRSQRISAFPSLTELKIDCTSRVAIDELGTCSLLQSLTLGGRNITYFSGGRSAHMGDGVIARLAKFYLPTLTRFELMDAPYVSDTRPLSIFGKTLNVLHLGGCGIKGRPSYLPTDLPFLKTLMIPWNTTVKSLGNYPLLERLECSHETHSLVWQKNIPLFSNYPMLSHFEISGFRHLTVEYLEFMMLHMPHLKTIETHEPAETQENMAGPRVCFSANAIKQWIHTQRDRSMYVSFAKLHETLDNSTKD